MLRGGILAEERYGGIEREWTAWRGLGRGCRESELHRNTKLVREGEGSPQDGHSTNVFLSLV
jgi:hypothetical protein